MYKTPYPAHRTTNDHASTTIIIQRPFVQELTKLYNHVGVENFIEMRNERALLRNKKKTAAHDKRIAELTAAIDKATSLRKSGDSFFKLMAALPRLSNATHTHRHECDDPGNCPDCKKRPRVKKDCAFWAKKRRGWCEPTNDGCTWTGILAGYLEHLYDTRPTHDQETVTDIALVLLNVGDLYDAVDGVTALSNTRPRWTRSTQRADPVLLKKRAMDKINAAMDGTTDALAKWLDIHCGAYAALDRNHVIHRTLTRAEKSAEYNACVQSRRSPAAQSSMVYGFSKGSPPTYEFEPYDTRGRKKFEIKKHSDTTYQAVNKAKFERNLLGTYPGVYVHAVCANANAIAGHNSTAHLIKGSGSLLLTQLPTFEFLFPAKHPKTIGLTAATEELRDGYYTKQGYVVPTGLLKEANPESEDGYYMTREV